MRTRLFVLIPAVVAATLLAPISSAHAAGCLAGHPWDWAPGVTHVVGSTPAGTPCGLSFGERGGVIEALRIVVRPSHGILGSASPEGNRHYLAFVPAAGFTGRDRFELFIQVIPRGSASSLTTRFKVEIDVTP
jgi:hypothetical protein